MHHRLAPRLACLVLLAACGASTPPPSPTSPRDDAAEVTRRADEILKVWIETYPHQAASAGLRDAPDDGLEDNSLPSLAAWRAREDAWAKRLDAIDADGLWGRPEWITYGFVRELI